MIQLPRRRLGRTGLDVTGVALGGVGVGGAYGPVLEDRGIEAVHYAIERGINYIDTSPLYGDSERRLGLALSGGLREKVILSTKTGTHPERRGDYSRDGTLWSVENSLKLLRTDHLEIVLAHDPESLDQVFAPGGALDTLEELRSQGVVRFIGLGQRRHDFHTRAIESGRFDVILTYNDYNPVRTTALTRGLLQAAARHNVGVVNGSPMAHGLLTGEDPDQIVARRQMQPGDRELTAARKLYQWTRHNEIPMAAVVFQFCLRQPLIHTTLSGASTREELAENLDAALSSLPEELWSELEALHLTAGQTQPGED